MSDEYSVPLSAPDSVLIIHHSSPITHHLLEVAIVGRAVGIDLGTTYSAVACVDEYGKPLVLKNSDGQTTTPSVVYIAPPHYAVGDVALQSTMTDPGSVVQFIKRFMGVRDYRVKVAGRSFSPEFISSIIL